MIRFLKSFALAAALVVGVAGPASAQSAGGMALDAVGGSAVSGAVTLSSVPGEVPALQLTLEASGLEPSASYTVHLHAGSYAAPSASFGTLGQFQADAQGRGRLQTTSMRFAAAGEAIGLTPELLLDGEHFVDLHGGSETVARARLPRQSTGPVPAAPESGPAAAGTQLPPTGGIAAAALVGIALIASLAVTSLALSRRIGSVR